MINCLYFNARSLINKLDFFEAIVNVLNVDVIGVTESWATPQILDSELSLPGFHMFRNDRKSDNRGGGVLLYVHEKFKPVEFTPVTSFQDNVWCQIGDLFIGVCYRSANYAIVGVLCTACVRCAAAHARRQADRRDCSARQFLV